MSIVTVTECRSYNPKTVSTALQAALEPLGGLGFVTPGMRVGLKMNLLTGKHYKTATTTHPVVLAELTRLLTERGARVIIGDSPGGPFTEARLRAMIKPAGLALAAEAGAEINLNTGAAERTNPGASTLKIVNYTSWIDECDVLISCAKLKTHAMLGMTGAVKNIFGTVPGVIKAEYHSLYPDADVFSDMLVDLCEFIKPRLSIIDGIVGMEGNGPSSGTAREVGCIIASANPYHADVVMAHIMGLDPGRMPLIRAANRRGLSPLSVREIEVTGDPNRFRLPDFKNIGARGIFFGKRQNGILMRLLNLLLARRPAVDRSLCTSCGHCAAACPQKAISLGRFPEFDYKNCIRCYCCQELCPKNAIYVKRMPLLKLLR